MQQRLDQQLVTLGLCESRERAQALILGGHVEVNGQVVRKAGNPVKSDAEVRVRTQALPFVSRGGLKLRHALDFFHIDVTGALAVDVGASTGGFTDCLLQAGAAQVCAIDVGYGQFAWSLRQDSRVMVLERTNARYLDAAALPFAPDVAVCDVSFISQTLILPRLVEFLRLRSATKACPIVTLIKPQFEVGKGQVGKGGVVRDPILQEQAIARCIAAAESLHCTVLGVTPSPLRGPAGNEEFLLALKTQAVEN